MTDHNSGERMNNRLDELLAKREAGGLSLEEQGELDELLVAGADSDRYEHLAGRLIVAYDEASGESDLPPGAMVDRIKTRARFGIAGSAEERTGGGRAGATAGAIMGWAIAALLAIGAAAGYVVLTQRQATVLDERVQRIAEAEQRLEANRQIIQTALARAETLESELLESERRGTDLASALDESRRSLAEARQQGAALAAQLNEATSALDEAELRIAKLEAPIDPAEIRANRQKLLEVPDTVRLAWSPFDLEGAPAEQREVTGDVVWNDELQQGYLRFVGLEPNDPSVEQYQVWVIDERGMEQKVSGGVFNANADGEVIVPIDPAIDVGRVALFAITIEEPGGTWVPDLSRRVVVAPRG